MLRCTNVNSKFSDFLGGAMDFIIKFASMMSDQAVNASQNATNSTTSTDKESNSSDK